MKSQIIFRKLAGISLVESVFVIAILGILVVVGLGGYQEFQRRTNISGLLHEVASYIERARVLSTVYYEQKRYGVHFDPSQYTLFKGDTYVSGAAGNEVRTLKNFRFVNPAVFSDGLGGTTSTVLFAPLSGFTVNSGTIQIQSTVVPTLTRNITINSIGSITAQ